ncbi:MAG: hypothetical protein GX575_13750 [Candidatus Anammoximicrobium sp.]|nr:hypothetical protein [Candidatus Anammoximicrobium sp.]
MTAKRTDLEREALSRLTASTAAWLLGMSDSGFRAAKPPKGDDGRTYDARALVAWHVGRQQKADPLMDVPSSDSPSLERYRTAKARLAELAYEQACRTVLPVAEVRSAVVGMTMPLRRASEELGRRFGADAQKIVNDAISNYAAALRRQFTQGGEDDNHHEA